MFYKKLKIKSSSTDYDKNFKKRNLIFGCWAKKLVSELLS